MAVKTALGEGLYQLLAVPAGFVGENGDFAQVINLLSSHFNKACLELVERFSANGG